MTAYLLISAAPLAALDRRLAAVPAGGTLRFTYDFTLPSGRREQVQVLTQAVPDRVGIYRLTTCASPPVAHIVARSLLQQHGGSLQHYQFMKIVGGGTIGGGPPIS